MHLLSSQEKILQYCLEFSAVLLCLSIGKNAFQQCVMGWGLSVCCRLYTAVILNFLSDLIQNLHNCILFLPVCYFLSCLHIYSLFIKSTLDLAESGWYLAEYGCDLAECGWDLAESGCELCRVWIRSSREWIGSSRLWMRSSRVWLRSIRKWMRSSREWMTSSRLWMKSSREWMRSSRL